MTDVRDRPRSVFRPSPLTSVDHQSDAGATGFDPGVIDPRFARIRSSRNADAANVDALTSPLKVVDVRRRLLVLLLVVLLAAGGLVWRLVQLQIVEPGRYVERGEAQRTRVIDLPGPRGRILDRNGNSLALTYPQQSFFVDPQYVEDARGAAQALAPVLGQAEELLYEKFTADSRFVYLERQVGDSVAEAVEALNIPGVYQLEEPKRFNPAGEDLGISIIGRVGVDSQPLGGIEYAYNEWLAGEGGRMVVEKDRTGTRTIPVAAREVTPASPGNNLILTIDRSLQHEVEHLLLSQVDAMAAKGGVAVVTQTKTGEILAMASVDRDANLNVQLADTNLATQWAYEPGSVMKAVTFGSVLDSGIAEPGTVREVPWSIELYDREFTDITPHEPIDLTVADIVTQSSNVGSIMWASDLGATEFDNYLRSFGFGSTVLNLPGETSGLLADRPNWDGTAIGAIALGQGVSVTALQMIQAFNVIANDGADIPLHVVRNVVSPDGDILAIPNTERTSVISDQSAREMRAILQNVVANGTGAAAQVDGYDVAGKTGTARKAQPGGGYQDADGYFSYVSSFAGFLPAGDPELSILVTIDEPATSIYASKVAAPVFADIAHYALRHFGIPPSAPLLESAPTTAQGGPVAEDGIAVRSVAQLELPPVVPVTIDQVAPAPEPDTELPPEVVQDAVPGAPVDEVVVDVVEPIPPVEVTGAQEPVAAVEPAAVDPAAVVEQPVAEPVVAESVEGDLAGQGVFESAPIADAMIPLDAGP